MNTSRPLVLVVEDNADMREFICIVIEGLDLSAKLAANMDEALEIFSHHPDIGLVLLDLGFPGSGMRVDDFMERIRKLRPSEKVKFIVASGRENLADEAKRLQADSFLFKPFAMSQLQNSILKIFEPSRYIR